MMQWLRRFFDWLAGGSNSPKPLPPPTSPKIEEPSAPAVNKPYKMGDKDLAISKIQQRLKDLGYLLEVDGDFGEETRAQVLEFQEANQIGLTGVVGPQTWRVLFGVSAKGPVKIDRKSSEAAEIARIEANKKLQWRASGAMSSEAEKYLASVRGLIGMPSGRFPWCAGFVFWCLKKAGIDMSHLGRGAAYVPSWVAWAKGKKLWHPSTEKSFSPRLGDIVVFDWNDNGTEDPEHIGFVLSYDGGSYITTAEGNTSDQSSGNGDSTAIRSRHWDTIEGFIRL